MNDIDRANLDYFHRGIIEDYYVKHTMTFEVYAIYSTKVYNILNQQNNDWQLNSDSGSSIQS